MGRATTIENHVFPGKLSAQGRNRTTDTGIFSPLLYRLSYLGETAKRARSLPFTRREVNRIRTRLASHYPFDVALP
jgi:hypothetical protein